MKQLKSHKTFEGQTTFWSHSSDVTQTEMKFSTFIPKGEVKGCLIWLSGLTCTDENFISKAGAHKYLAHENLMIICPDTSPRGLSLPGEHDSYDFGSGAGFYLNATVSPYADHYRMYDYITKDLHSIIEKDFEMRAISICGHSMGGHGALVIGLKNPDKYQVISAFSPIVNPINAPWGEKAFLGYLGADKESWKMNDATELILAGHTHPQKILIHQGTQDEFLKDQLLTEKIIEVAQKQGQALEVIMSEGYDHSYYFISTFIGEHIKHHAQHLKAKTQGI
jgi:S-formylglutathione hydrolase